MPLQTTIEGHTFCPIPWIHSSTTSLGDLRVCCICNYPPLSYLEKDNKTIYNAKIDVIPRNHKLYKEMRLAMLDNKKHPLCKQCWDREQAGLLSQREVIGLHFYPDVMEKAIKLTKTDGSINEEDFPVRYYDLRFGNKCNCRCIICNAKNSSMWAGKVTDWSGDLDTPYLKDLIKNLEHVDRLYLTGGEPTINENYQKLFDLIIQKGYNKNINLVFNTNCVVLTKDILNTWGKFKSVGAGFSIDGIGKIFEQIRIPAKWEVVKKNILLFEKESLSNTYASFTITVSKINILNILELFKWYSQQKFKKIQPNPQFNILIHPPNIDIRSFNLEQKNEIKQKYEEFYIWMDENLSKEDINLCKPVFQGIINSMMESEEF